MGEETKHHQVAYSGNRFIVRPSRPEDAEGILQLVETAFGDRPEAGETHMTYLVQRIMSDIHPTLRPDDFTLIEDLQGKERRIVGCTGLLRHTWEYEGIPFAVGRPEIIATFPDYRFQGLIRAIFAMVHARSAEQGHLVQAITGIPYFYRQFDYEYALDLWDICNIDVINIPPLQENVSERFSLRDAELADIPLIQHLYENQRRKGLVSLRIDEQWWRHQIQTWSDDASRNINSHIQMIVDEAARSVGYVITSTPQARKYMQIWDLEVMEEIHLPVDLPAILRALYTQGSQERAFLQQDGYLQELRFMLLQTHPAFPQLRKFSSRVQKPTFAWYIRVGDLPSFIAHVAPVLEKRLALADQASFCGELKFDFYRSGLRLVFEQGHLQTAETWRQTARYVKADAGFPPHVFLQLLFGRRNLDELRFIFPDVWVQDNAEFLLQILFPARPSWVLPLW
jgi:N-acetylglutamate synthase-like GNAT family acetyltransferase